MANGESNPDHIIPPIATVTDVHDAMRLSAVIESGVLAQPQHRRLVADTVIPDDMDAASIRAAMKGLLSKPARLQAYADRQHSENEWLGTDEELVAYQIAIEKKAVSFQSTPDGDRSQLNPGAVALLFARMVAEENAQSQGAKL